MIPQRLIEMAIGEGEGGGQWWTEFVSIPRDTPEGEIERAGSDTWVKAHQDDKRIIGIVVAYWIPELDFERNPVYFKTRRDFYATELAMLDREAYPSIPDFVMIPAGAIVEQGPEGSDPDSKSVDIVYDHPEYLLVGNVEAFVPRADLEELP